MECHDVHCEEGTWATFIGVLDVISTAAMDPLGVWRTENMICLRIYNLPDAVLRVALIHVVRIKEICSIVDFPSD